MVHCILVDLHKTKDLNPVFETCDLKGFAKVVEFKMGLILTTP